MWLRQLLNTLDVIVKKTVTIGELRDVVADKCKHPHNAVRITLYANPREPLTSELDCMALEDLQVSKNLRAHLLAAPADDTRDHKAPGAAGDEEGKDGSKVADGDDDDDAAPTADTTAWDAMYAGQGAAWAARRKLPHTSSQPTFRPMDVRGVRC